MVKTYKDLKVYQKAFELMMEIFYLVKGWPKEERYNLTDQILRSSRSVCGNVAEAWRRRRYKNVFIHQLDEAGGSATETQVWLDVALACKYIDQDRHQLLYNGYDEVGKMLIDMIGKADQFCESNLTAHC